MTKKKFFLNNWWLDSTILNPNLTSFKFSVTNNIFYLNLSSKFLFYFFLINKNNLNNYYFYILDSTILTNYEKKEYQIAYQSIFFDLKILVNVKFKQSLQSLTKIYKASSWVERENKEFNNITFDNLNDTRKLLSNYNYNKNLQYNNFNNILNDLHV